MMGLKKGNDLMALRDLIFQFAVRQKPALFPELAKPIIETTFLD